MFALYFGREWKDSETANIYYILLTINIFQLCIRQYSNYDTKVGKHSIGHMHIIGFNPIQCQALFMPVISVINVWVLRLFRCCFLPLQIGTGKSQDAVFIELAIQVSWGCPSRMYPVTQLYLILSPTSNLVPYKTPLGGTPGFPQELLCNSVKDTKSHKSWVWIVA